MGERKFLKNYGILKYMGKLLRIHSITGKKYYEIFKYMGKLLRIHTIHMKNHFESFEVFKTREF